MDQVCEQPAAPGCKRGRSTPARGGSAACLLAANTFPGTSELGKARYGVEFPLGDPLNPVHVVTLSGPQYPGRRQSRGTAVFSAWGTPWSASRGITPDSRDLGSYGGKVGGGAPRE